MEQRQENLVQTFMKKKIKILHNTSGIEETKFENQKNYTKNFLYLTNYIKSKGIVELIECFADSELQSFSLDTFGNIYEPKTYDEILAKKTQNITIHGPITREQLKSTLKKFPLLRGKGKFLAKKKPITISLDKLKVFKKGSKVDLDSLIEKGIISKKDAFTYGVKILGKGSLRKDLEILVPMSK